VVRSLSLPRCLVASLPALNPRPPAQSTDNPPSLILNSQSSPAPPQPPTTDSPAVLGVLGGLCGEHLAFAVCLLPGLNPRQSAKSADNAFAVKQRSTVATPVPAPGDRPIPPAARTTQSRGRSRRSLYYKRLRFAPGADSHRTDGGSAPRRRARLPSCLVASVPCCLGASGCGRRPRCVLCGELLLPEFALQIAPGASKNPVFRKPHPLKVIGRQVIGVEERIPQARMRVADATGGRDADKKKATGTRRARQAPNARVRPIQRRCHGRIRPMTQLNIWHRAIPCPGASRAPDGLTRPVVRRRPRSAFGSVRRSSNAGRSGRRRW